MKLIQLCDIKLTGVYIKINLSYIYIKYLYHIYIYIYITADSTVSAFWVSSVQCWC